MTFSLIVCTYMRPKALLNLLKSVKRQTLYPNEILIIDGSENNESQILFVENSFENLKYFKVNEKNRGLTRQRNYGLSQVDQDIDIICFVDDDTELTPNYFDELIKTYKNTSITGVGGLAINENNWKEKINNVKYNTYKYYEIDGYVVKEGSRNVMRNYLGLSSNKPPGVMPEFSHGKSYGYPFNGKIYEVDLLIGMSFSFHRKVFQHMKFSTYFEGYGLYEDADYSIRALRFGKNVINTNVKLYHYHDVSGRPNSFKYGKMVLRNGWYVWRVKYPNPKLKAIIKWHLTSFLLTSIRFGNVFTKNKREEALKESIGRVVGWWSLLFNKPKVNAYE